MGNLSIEAVFQSNIPTAADFTIAVVYTVFGICSLLGNSMLLYVSYRKKHLLKPAEFFIINLAVSDTCLTLSLYPLAIFSSFSHRWLFGWAVCFVYAFCGVLFGICSMTTLTLLSLVCFVKVCYPLYGNRFSSSHIRTLLVFAWSYSLVFACSPLAHWGEYGPEPYGTACCIDWSWSNRRSGARCYMVVLFVCCYLLPCIVIVTSYTGIVLALRDARRSLEQHRPAPARIGKIHTIIVKLSLAVCSGFLAAWSPYAVVSMWAAFGQIDNIPPLAFAVPAMFAKSSTIYNPVVYLLLRPNFRRVVRRDLGLIRRSCLQKCFCFLPRRRPRCPDSHAEAPAASAANEKACENCRNAFRCFGRNPGECRLSVIDDDTSLQNAVVSKMTTVKFMEKSTNRSINKISMRSRRRVETEHFKINIETANGLVKTAWP